MRVNLFLEFVNPIRPKLSSILGRIYQKACTIYVSKSVSIIFTQDRNRKEVCMQPRAPFLLTVNPSATWPYGWCTSAGTMMGSLPKKTPAKPSSTIFSKPWKRLTSLPVDRHPTTNDVEERTRVFPLSCRFGALSPRFSVLSVNIFFCNISSIPGQLQDQLFYVVCPSSIRYLLLQWDFPS